MSTLYKRMSHYCLKKKINLPDFETRKVIGKIVVDAWFSPTNKLSQYIPLHHHIFLDETNQPQRVLSYPKIFNPVIDRIIEQQILIANKSIKTSVLIQKENINNHVLKESCDKSPRKRSHGKTPVYSYKPKGV